MKVVLHIAIALALALPVSAQQKDPHDTAMYDEEIFVAVEAHVADRIGEYDNVWHELVSPDIHVDILPIEPTDARPFWVLCTVGMSYREIGREVGLHFTRVGQILKDAKDR